MDTAIRHIGSQRVLSIDIFRGLVMVLMIFVNFLESVKGLPWWTYHAHANEDRMTYVDVVFPAFLFAIGLSLPLAIRARLEREPSLAGLWRHIAGRSASLIAFGLILANADRAMWRWWPDVTLLAATGTVLVAPRQWRLRLRVLGWTGVLVLLACYRGVDAKGHTRWLDFGYWEILGIIGFTYVAVCILYVPFRKSTPAIGVWFVAACAFNMLCAAHIVNFGNDLPLYLWPWSNGAFVLLVLAGTLTTRILITERRPRRFLVVFGFSMAIVAMLSTPLGISKIRATPTWSIASAAICLAVFAALYWICDVQGVRRWPAFVRVAGGNTFLTYLAPDFFAYTTDLAFVPAAWWIGAAGVLFCAFLTGLMLIVATALTRAGVRLQL